MATQKELDLQIVPAAAVSTKRARRPKKEKAPPTVQALVKSARQVMRKDKGLNGELDRLPALTWMLLLKLLDDRETEWEAEARMAGERYAPVIEAPYRWRDWAVSGGPTGDQLLRFVEDAKARRPDGTEGPGLLAALRSLAGTPRREVVAAVFEGVRNKMTSGYLLRDVAELVGALHFDDVKDVQALGLVYESLLREMRDAAGDSGEFYTPRPVVRFATARLDPRPGEVVLDPACGTGGFLVAAYEHLRRAARTADDVRAVEDDAVRGVEPKSLPYLLCQMNLLLHGVESPHVERTNSLAVRLSEIGEAEQVDVVLTNPPFGGEEEAGILAGFPVGMQTRETATLFLQLILKRLHSPGDGRRGGRAAVVVPNGSLFADGVAAKVRELLLDGYNLHTVLRLPDGVFAPYTDIPANVLFFEATGGKGGTKTVWFYEVPPPDGRKKYTKTRPLTDADLEACAAWWDAREENDRAWKVDIGAELVRARHAERSAETDEDRAAAAALKTAALNLDRKNPQAGAAADHRPPEEIAAALVARQTELVAVLREIEAAVAGSVHV